MAEQTTKIDLYLKKPNGNPLTNTRVLIRPVRAGFWSSQVGLVEDKDIIYQTDSHGYVQMKLWPLPYAYRLTYSYDDNATPGEFLFYVPQIDTPVQFQDLIVTRADSSDKYGDEILKQMIQIKADTQAIENRIKAIVAAQLGTVLDNKIAQINAALNQSNQNVAISNQVLSQFQTAASNVESSIATFQSINVLGKVKLNNYYIWVDPAG